MRLFWYRAMTADGASVSGSGENADLADLMATLATQNLQPYRVWSLPGQLGSQPWSALSTSRSPGRATGSSISRAMMSNGTHSLPAMLTRSVSAVGFACISRIALLLTLAWLAGLTHDLFALFGQGIALYIPGLDRIGTRGEPRPSRCIHFGDWNNGINNAQRQSFCAFDRAS